MNRYCMGKVGFKPSFAGLSELPLVPGCMYANLPNYLYPFQKKLPLIPTFSSFNKYILNALYTGHWAGCWGHNVNEINMMAAFTKLRRCGGGSK